MEVKFMVFTKHPRGMEIKELARTSKRSGREKKWASV